MTIRQTHTYAVLEVSPAAYREIRGALEAAGYAHAFHQGGDGEVIDMHGIALGVGARPEAPAAAGNFDVLKEMSRRNLDIRLSPLENVTQARAVKAGTLVTIGCGGDLVAAIGRGAFCGGLILAREEQFDQVKAEIEARGAGR